MTSELRQLRRVRWGVRLTLALGISASLAANILHAHHVLIDQVIAGWPPVAVFATIEAIARVPIRRRWLAAIRMTGLGFVAGIAFWVSYWHMASVAAAHGENGSKYLLPLSVDGLVVVASISLVELTGQISAVEAATRSVATPAATAPGPVDSQAPPSARRDRGARFPRHDRPPERDTAAADAPPAAAPFVGGDKSRPVAPDRPRVRSVVKASAPALAVTGTAGRATEPLVDAGCKAPGDEVPPEHPSQAIIWWRAKDPTLTLSQIAARVGRSERTVRRILDAAPIPAAPRQLLTPGPAAESGPVAGDLAAAHPSGGRHTNGAPVEDLAGSVASPI